MFSDCFEVSCSNSVAHLLVRLSQYKYNTRTIDSIMSLTLTSNSKHILLHVANREIYLLLPVELGSTENAGPENAGPISLRELNN